MLAGSFSPQLLLCRLLIIIAIQTFHSAARNNSPGYSQDILRRPTLLQPTILPCIINCKNSYFELRVLCPRNSIFRLRVVNRIFNFFPFCLGLQFGIEIFNIRLHIHISKASSLFIVSLEQSLPDRTILLGIRSNESF